MNEQNLFLSESSPQWLALSLFQNESVFLDIQQVSKICERLKKKTIWLNTAPSSRWCVALDEIDSRSCKKYFTTLDNRVGAKHCFKKVKTNFLSLSPAEKKIEKLAKLYAGYVYEDKN